MTENFYCSIHHITYESEVERGKVVRLCPQCEPERTKANFDLLATEQVSALFGGRIRITELEAELTEGKEAFENATATINRQDAELYLLRKQVSVHGELCAEVERLVQVVNETHDINQENFQAERHAIAEAVRDMITYIDRHALADRIEKGGAMNECRWIQDDNWEMSNHWTASCGLEWCMDEETPSKNGMKFCPSCGKPLVEVPYVEPPDEEEEEKP